MVILILFKNWNGEFEENLHTVLIIAKQILQINILEAANSFLIKICALPLTIIMHCNLSQFNWLKQKTQLVCSETS